MEKLIVFLIFMAITGISGAINKARQNELEKKKQERLQRRQARGGMNVDEFLNEGAPPQRRDDFIDPQDVKPVQPARRPPERPQKSRDDVWREQTGRPQQSSPPPRPKPEKSKRQKPGNRPKAPDTARSTQPKSAVAERHVASTVAQQHLQSRVGEQVSKDLPNSVAQAVSADLGKFSGGSALLETTSRQNSPAAVLLQELRTPAGKWKAVMINEILGPPLSLRK